MRMSKMYVPTLKETPAEAEVISHQLMLRAGMIRKVGSGVYTYLPLGQRVMRNLEEIIREEMNKAGAQECLMPALQPASLWEESGRLEDYGPELMRLHDRHEREFCLGPTHEEVITDLVRDEVRSYKELPLNLYQIQTKYRDEIRPRFGVLRAREFIMKDAYSFDLTEEGLDESYQKMYDAYNKIFSRCGLDFRPVEADTGAIGGDVSHEFMVLADAGEDTVIYCTECDYAANLELAKSGVEEEADNEELKEIEEVSTPNCTTIKELEEELKLSADKMIKSVLYQTKEEPILALVRGDYDINEVKLSNFLGVVNVELAEEEVYQELNTVKGFTGPVDLEEEVKIIADELVMEVVNGVTGANKADKHYLNVNPGRDFAVDEVLDIREIKPGESCIHCSGKLEQTPGIEVGQVFKLGTKYSKALDAAVLDQNGKARPLIMGCYGIGVSRTVAAAIEQNHDDYGIKWPKALAPYKIEILPLGNSSEVNQTADKLYHKLQDKGISVLIDDRKESAGVKFNDADLIGCPLIVTIGSRSLEENKVEIKNRQTGEKFKLEVDKLVPQIEDLFAELD